MNADKHSPPILTALFIAVLLVVFGGLALWNYEHDIQIAEGNLRIPKWNPWKEAIVLEEKKEQARVDSLKLIAIQDSLSKANAVRVSVATPGKGIIEFAPNDSIGFGKLMRALSKAKSGRTVRIIHFGDSQIEGDRITGDLRNALQGRYGGEGPGMQPLVPFVSNANVSHSTSGEWIRMVSFGRQNDKSPTNQYGPRGVSHRFIGGYASVRLSPRSSGYARAKRFKNFTLLYGPPRGSLEIKWFANDTLWQTTYLDSIPYTGAIQISATEPVKSLRIEFRGVSPDFYGISIEGNGGISADNIAMRGADGLSFTRMDRTHFIQSLKRQSVGLVILQFGGNSVPWFKSREAVERHGEAFRRQIRLFQEALPEADILIIGPSDMAYKNGMSWVSYPYVDDVRDVLKEAAFKEGAGFFDIMNYMGGPGSMVEWVNARPQLAGPDHIHFTPRGARKVAEALVEALQEELERYE